MFDYSWKVGQSYIISDQFSKIVGAVYYQAGTIVLIPEHVSSTASNDSNFWYFSASVTASYDHLVSGTGSTVALMNETIQGMRQRLLTIDYRNQATMRNTFYTCVAERSEFNYSPNSSFINQFGQIYTTSGSQNEKSKTYITRVGLLGQNDEVIAVGQLNRPIRKDPNLRVEIKVRLDT